MTFNLLMKVVHLCDIRLELCNFFCFPLPTVSLADKYIDVYFLFQGYITAGSPQAALGVHDEILRHGLNPDRLSYNTLIFACIKNENLEKAMLLYEQMKVACSV